MSWHVAGCSCGTLYLYVASKCCGGLAACQLGGCQHNLQNCDGQPLVGTKAIQLIALILLSSLNLLCRTLLPSHWKMSAMLLYTQYRIASCCQLLAASVSLCLSCWPLDTTQHYTNTTIRAFHPHQDGLHALPQAVAASLEFATRAGPLGASPLI